MTTRAVFVLRVAGVILLTGGALIGLSQFFPDFQNDNVRQFPSPDGTRTAVLYRRTGPDSAITTNVSLVQGKSAVPDGGGNALVARGQPAVVVKWADNENLAISGLPDSVVRFRARAVDGVRISDR